MSERPFPLSADEMPRAGGISTMMRLPFRPSLEGLDACFVGVPMDIGASNKAGTRHGPRHIRLESAAVRPFNVATGAAPFETMSIADIGDIPINTFNLLNSVEIIERQYKAIVANGCVPLTMGGDHTISYPILKAVSAKHGPVALIQIDAHGDVNDEMFGSKITHGTPFRRAYEDGCLAPEKVFQIGLRGSGYSRDDYQWARNKGFHVIPAEDCWYKSLKPLIDDIRGQIGDTPTYITYDIDSLDPSFAPGTGVPEIGGLSIWQALELLRGCRGLNIVGADLVEVCPAYDVNGTTSHVAANLLFEMLCVLPKCVRKAS